MLDPILCVHNVYKLFLRKFSLNESPPWVDITQKAVEGNGPNLSEEKCYDEESKNINETTVEDHADCYEKINDTEIFFEQLHLWLDGLLVPFTGKKFSK